MTSINSVSNTPDANPGLSTTESSEGRLEQHTTPAVPNSVEINSGINTPSINDMVDTEEPPNPVTSPEVIPPSVNPEFITPPVFNIGQQTAFSESANLSADKSEAEPAQGLSKLEIGVFADKAVKLINSLGIQDTTIADGILSILQTRIINEMPDGSAKYLNEVRSAVQVLYQRRWENIKVGRKLTVEDFNMIQQQFEWGYLSADFVDNNKPQSTGFVAMANNNITSSVQPPS